MSCRDTWASIADDATDATDASYTLQRPSGIPLWVGIEPRSKKNASVASEPSVGADPYDAEERLAIQEEGREISSLPDKPIFSLAEQAALVLDGYNGDREQAAADLRVVARNFALADYIEHGITPAESPASSLAESTTPMTPDRGFDDVPGFAGMLPLPPSEHGAILHRLMNPAQEAPAPALSTTDATASPTMQPAPAMAPQSALRNSGPMVPILEKDRHGETIVRGFRLATQQPARPSAPATITCGSCGEFEPGWSTTALADAPVPQTAYPPLPAVVMAPAFPMHPVSVQIIRNP